MDWTKINWRLLQAQKRTLTNLSELGTSVDIEHIQGLIHLLDFIQDQGVASGLPEEEVFGSFDHWIYTK